jgi:hypothetical protein
MNRATSYKLHIAPLFTKEQQECMSGKFDLFSYLDVKQRCSVIYSRLADKSMPQDESNPWPYEWIALFKRWIDEGCAP